MIEFDDLAAVPKNRVYTGAMVSRDTGDRVLADLIASGTITPTTTGTRRVLLTVTDARLLWQALTKR